MFRRRNLIVVLVVLILLSLASWAYFGGESGPTYESLIVEPTTLVQEVSVTGRVEANREVDLAAKRSGRVVRLGARAGAQVAAGATLLELDAAREARAVTSAELELESAKLALTKLTSPNDRQLVQSELSQDYESGLATAASVYGSLFGILDDLDTIFFGDDLSPTSSNEDNLAYYARTVSYHDSRFKDFPIIINQDYHKLVTDANAALKLYQTSRTGGQATAIENALFATHDVLKQAVNVLKQGRDLVQFFKDRSVADNWQPLQPTVVDGHLADLSSFYTEINGYWLDLNEVVTAIKSKQSTIEVDDLDIASARLEVKKAESDLAEAREDYADSFLRAPFGGTVTSVEPEVGELISASEAVVSMISFDELNLEANVPEADVAKIKVGDSARVTLDAYGGDEVFNATVQSIDPAAEVIDGVATYRTVLHFLTPNTKIKSGMTAEIDITGERRENVLAVPQRAVVNEIDRKFVHVRRGGVVVEQEVQTGFRGADGRVEITSGLTAGDEVVSLIVE
ncbi:MAG: efflux RND transporter periplasmic adaptor subunit [Patescibacteria group bacterium]